MRRVAGQRTATYTAMMDANGDLSAAVADMEVNGAISPEHIGKFRASIEHAPLCVVDCNLSKEGAVAFAALTRASKTPLWLEPTSVPKAAQACSWLREASLLDAITYASPNDDEVLAMAAALTGQRPTAGDGDGGDAAVRAAASVLVRAGVAHVFVTRGARGILWARAADASPSTVSAPSGTAAAAAAATVGAWGGAPDVHFEELPAAVLGSSLKSTRGAGDCFVAGTAWRLQLASSERQDKDGGGRLPLGVDAIRTSLVAGLRAARLSVMDEEAVPDTLSAAALLDLEGYAGS